VRGSGVFFNLFNHFLLYYYLKIDSLEHDAKYSSARFVNIPNYNFDSDSNSNNKSNCEDPGHTTSEPPDSRASETIIQLL
jgi:hypothetical protein